MVASKMNARTCRVLGGIGAVFAFLLLIFNLNHHTSPLRERSKSSGHDGRLNNIYNATLGFERVFIINLPTRSDTRDLWTLAGHLTNVSVEFRNGVTDVHAKARPPGAEKFTNMPALGAWRANMDILQEMVAKGISSALIMEDDTDCDIRIKSQLETFARASRLLLQPGGDPLQSFEEDISKLKRLDSLRKEPTSSPYGDLDQWDVLWLGHLGTHTPDPGKGGNVAILNDHTVPEKQHIGDDWDDDQLSRYPDHTRIVERSIYTMGSQAYAISLPGARKMLYECGTKRIERAGKAPCDRKACFILPSCDC